MWWLRFGWRDDIAWLTSLEGSVIQPVRYVHHLRLKFAKRSFHGGLQEFREHHAETVNRCVHSHVSHVASSFAVSLWQPLTPRSLHGPRQGQGLQLSHNRVTAAVDTLKKQLYNLYTYTSKL